ncbi:MAG: AMP-binding protein [Steroidobacteraceae bacterium]
MLGLMQNHPLLISSLIEHAAVAHPHAEIVSRTPAGGMRRHTYPEIAMRAGQVAGALTLLGVTEGTRLGTLAWNTHRHLELFYGISGIGAVLHTVNPRLYPEQIEYIVNHAGDSYLFVDASFVPLIERLAPRLESVRTFVILTDPQHMPRENTAPRAASNVSSCNSNRGAQYSASRSRRAAPKGRSVPGTAERRAACSFAGTGLLPAITAANPERFSIPTVGSIPATSQPSMPMDTCRSRTGQRMS